MLGLLLGLLFLLLLGLALLLLALHLLLLALLLALGLLAPGLLQHALQAVVLLLKLLAAQRAFTNLHLLLEAGHQVLDVTDITRFIFARALLLLLLIRMLLTLLIRLLFLLAGILLLIRLLLVSLLPLLLVSGLMALTRNLQLAMGLCLRIIRLRLLLLVLLTGFLLLVLTLLVLLAGFLLLTKLLLVLLTGFLLLVLTLRVFSRLLTFPSHLLQPGLMALARNLQLALMLRLRIVQARLLRLVCIRLAVVRLQLRHDLAEARIVHLFLQSTHLLKHILQALAFLVFGLLLVLVLVLAARIRTILGLGLLLVHFPGLVLDLLAFLRTRFVMLFTLGLAADGHAKSRHTDGAQLQRLPWAVSHWTLSSVGFTRRYARASKWGRLGPKI